MISCMREENLPLISVIVLTYNSAEYVISTLDSIRRQDYAGPIEIIIGDDCSQDNTVEICRNWLEEHAERFQRTTLLRSGQNQGVVGNYNSCIQIARGEWIKGIAGDDILANNALSLFFSTATEGEGERLFLYSSLCIFQEESQLQEPEKLRLLVGGPGNAEINLNYIFKKPAFWTNAPSFFFSRKLMEDIGYIPQLFRNVEDRPMFAKVLASGYSIYHISTPTVYYRVHEASLTSSMAGVRFAECNWKTYSEILRPCFGYLRRWDLDLRMLPQWYLCKQGGKSKKVSMFKLGCKLLWLIYRTLTFAFTLRPTRVVRCQKGMS